MLSNTGHRALWRDLEYSEPRPIGDNGAHLVDVLLVPVNEDGERQTTGTINVSTLRVSRFGRVEVVR